MKKVSLLLTIAIIATSCVSKKKYVELEQRYTNTKGTLQKRTLEKEELEAKFAKIEAEGAEPEVLDGAQAVLHLIDYIAVDCGFERGAKNEATFYACNKILSLHGFEIIDADLHRNSFLYKRAGVSTYSH